MKKLLSIVLSIAMTVTSLGIGTVAFADEAKSAVIEFSVYDQGVFTMTPTEINVSADLSDIYAEAIGYNDTIEEPSILDATIAAHIEMFGDDFMDYAPLTISSSGWIASSFGEDIGPSYCLNGNSVYSLNEALNDNDYIEYMYCQDTEMYTDLYSYFNTRNYTALPGESFTLNLTAVCYTWGTDPVPAEDITVTVDDNDYGVTDEDGNISLQFNEPGTHIVSAYGELDSGYIFAPYCKVSVVSLYDRMANATEFLTKDVESFDVISSVDYLTYLNSGYDMSKYNDNYVASVITMLNENDGKLVYAGNEDLGLYAGAIAVLTKLGFDASDFYGYDIVSSFESLDADQISNPYYYRVAIEVASEDFAKKLCDQLIADYYTMGSGMDYYGLSCDNTAVFITSIAKCASDYAEIVADAINVMNTYITEDGAFYNTTYTDVNADSTATAMMAYAALGDYSNWSKLYKSLIKFEGEIPGVIFAYGSNNPYATKEALLATEYAITSEHNKDVLVTEEITSPTCTETGKAYTYCIICGNIEVENIVIPAKGHNFGNNLPACTVCGTANPNYKAPVLQPDDNNQDGQNTIDSIEFIPVNPIQIVEKTNGYYMDGIYHYDYYNLIEADGNVMRVRYTDNTSKDFRYIKHNDAGDDIYNFVAEDGEIFKYEMDYDEHQNISNWTVGLNKLTLKHLDKTFTVPITIVETPVSSISATHTNKLLSDCLYGATFDVTVNYKDGSVKEYKDIVENEDFGDIEGAQLQIISCKHNDGANPAIVEYAGVTANTTINIVSGITVTDFQVEQVKACSEYSMNLDAFKFTLTFSDGNTYTASPAPRAGDIEGGEGFLISYYPVSFGFSHKDFSYPEHTTVTNGCVMEFHQHSSGISREIVLSDKLVTHTHVFVDTVVPPTANDKGYTLHKCACGYSYIDNYIDALQDVKTPITTPNITEPVVQVPTTVVETITVDGEVITPNADGEYVSTKAKKPVVAKATPAKKAMTVSWKKVAKVSGYQVQYATDKKFKKNKKSVNVKKAKTTKTTVKKLSSKKKYYVRIRTYKTVNGKKVYSGWSKAKAIKTK